MPQHKDQDHLDWPPPQQHQTPRTRSRRELHCHLCDRVFHKNEHLNRHVVSHTKEKRFRCRHCSKVYGRRDSLLRHARIHSRNKAAPNEEDDLSPSGTDPQFMDQGHLRPDQTRNIPSQPVGNSITASYPVNPLPQLGDQTCPDLHLSVSPLLARVSSAAPISLDRDPPQPLHYQHGVNVLGLAPHVGAQTALETISGPAIDPTQTFGTWDRGSEPWLFGDEFDFGVALNSYFATDLSNGLFRTPETAPDPGSAGQSQELFPAHDGTPSPDRRSVVADLWITRPATSPKSPCHEGASFDKGQLDESYRHHLSGKLRPSLWDGVLPPASFLNLCLKLFFLKFNPVLPLIHAPTFRPSAENALLVISMCSIGALFVGTTTAAKQGRDIFVKLNKAILASWETYVYKGGSETLHIAQAVILGQTFGMLSGNSNDLFMTNSFHGTIISWARQTGMLPAKKSEDAVKAYNGADVNARWKAWAQAEETVRFIAAIYVHDCEFTTFLHTAPFLRHGNVEKLPRCCSDELFAATTATAWQAVFDREQERRHQSKAGQIARKQSNGSTGGSPPDSTTEDYSSYLRSYVYLSSVIASISDAKQTSDYANQIPAISRRLYTWRYNKHLLLTSRDAGERANTYLTMLWHEAYLVLYTDLDCLERAVGREGPDHTEPRSDDDDEGEERREWRTPSHAARAVLHAFLNFKHLEVVPAGSEPAIHVPKTLFHSGLVMFRFLRLESSGSGVAYSAADFADSEFLGLPGLTTPEACFGLVQTVDVSVVSSIIDLLRSLGHFEISRRMALIIEALVDELISS